MRHLLLGLARILWDAARWSRTTALLAGIAVVFAYAIQRLGQEAFLRFVTWPERCMTGEPAYLFGSKITDDAGSLLFRSFEVWPKVSCAAFAVVFAAGWVVVHRQRQGSSGRHRNSCPRPAERGGPGLVNKPNRHVWLTIALLTVVVLGGVGVLGVRIRPYWVARFHGERADLYGAMLVSAPLQAANLHGAYLEAADLHAADLEAATFQGANLRGARLNGANLQRADLEFANLKGAHLRNAILRGAHLGGALLTGVDLQEADLCGADLHGADLGGASLQRADLQGANLTGVNLSDLGPRVSESQVGVGGDLRRANLHGAKLIGALLRRVDLRGADLTVADLSGADLRKARLAHAKLTGARYDAHTRWPEGFDPGAHGAVLVK